MEKRLIHSFVLLGILIVAGGFIFSYANFKFTGFAISPGGCDGNWTNVTGDCINGTQTTTWSSIDTTNCNSSVTESQTCVIDTNLIGTENQTTENQTSQNQTGNLTSCGDGIIQTPNSNNVNEECDNGANNGHTCSASGYGSSCSYCSSTCTVLTINGGSCGDGTCNSEENCSSCSSDCGSCTQEQSTDTTTTTTTTNDLSTDVTNDSVATTNTCTTNWECGDWQECLNGTQIRVCTDLNSCNSQTDIPSTSQSCVNENITTSNQQSQSKGFFGIIGNVVSGSIDGMFGNTTKTLISTGVLVLIIGGFVAFRFFYGRKNVNPATSASAQPQTTEENESEDEDEDDAPVDYSKFEKY